MRMWLSDFNNCHSLSNIEHVLDLTYSLWARYYYFSYCTDRNIQPLKQNHQIVSSKAGIFNPLTTIHGRLDSLSHEVLKLCDQEKFLKFCEHESSSDDFRGAMINVSVADADKAGVISWSSRPGPPRSRSATWYKDVQWIHMILESQILLMER